jgi:hypothetical protein
MCFFLIAIALLAAGASASLIDDCNALVATGWAVKAGWDTSTHGAGWCCSGHTVAPGVVCRSNANGTAVISIEVPDTVTSVLIYKYSALQSAADGFRHSVSDRHCMP